MLKNSNIYRRYWYVKKRKARKWFAILVLGTIFIILTILLSYAERNILPYLSQMSEQKAGSIVPAMVDSVLKDEFPDGVPYEELVNVQRDVDGNIISFESKFDKINSLSAQISDKVRERMEGLGKDQLAVPVGGTFGSSILKAIGPEIYMKIFLHENVKISVKSEFVKLDESQTLHRIALEINSIVQVKIPFEERNFNFISTIPVAETTIIGDVPAFYMNVDELPVEK